MNVSVFQVPYDSGYRNVRTGLGPGRLGRLSQAIVEDFGHQVFVCPIESQMSFPTEIETTFELNRCLASQVQTAVKNESFPLVFSGNCNSCVGTIAGIHAQRLGIIWMDAHGDFNTPETTTTGFLDGMGLAMATGRCWKALLETVPGFSAIDETHVMHFGGRDLDIEENNMFEKTGVIVVPPLVTRQTSFNHVFKMALSKLKEGVDQIYLHIDMDVLETLRGKPNHLAVSGGVLASQVETAIGMIKDMFSVCACAITGYDPSFDEQDCVLDAGARIIRSVLSR